MSFIRSAIAAIAVSLVLVPAAGLAETRVTLKSAKTGSSYYQMAVQLSEAVKRGSEGALILTVEESQGSVQNVMEVAARSGNYVFTTPPALVGAAAAATGPFKDKGNPRFAEIRALFPIPSLTMHFVVDADAGVSDLAGLAGKTILLGKGSFGATEGEKYLELFGLKDRVTIADAELSNAVAALKNGQIDAFVTAGSWPAPNVVEAAAGTGVTVLSLSEDEVAATKRTRTLIPAGTYAGQGADIVTTSLPVVTYATTDMDEATAYALTRTFWEERARMAGEAAWWTGVDAGLLASIDGKIHPGALKYYDEAGMPVAEANR
ncbi:TAXI family TRAP transporter solute-binding subunit [Limibaculum sp. FT325]|uniref:TAXI family TRAP transporter solute-binding subunit n=1 Tax=Thermohalobaculum sediminis TaxID=2939436 RepID=UPI0020BE979B|nr:TAXI family TRAP transporter solute-binding subunit [Limibaculum sediminis]MCL5777631.1 TAXI family TRAP transporter solute-binding subunit [Limibaculum sediminis]